jgi:glutamyl-tRNA synthetase
MTSAQTHRTRFAPSPTGAMHLGHARTHLVAWLRARSRGGRIVMRIEDLDPPRETPGAADAFLRDHEWLGLDFDEGPFHQSRRSDLYDDALARLEAASATYPCTCSRKDIERLSREEAGDGGPRYPGTCRTRSARPERAAAIRFRFDEPSPGFEDAIAGPVPAGIARGDFVLRRADGLYNYHLAVVVDDLDMGITEIVRGRDLLVSTARHIGLARALGGTPPTYAHVPLILDARGEKLSKRHSSVGIDAYRAAGRTPEELVGQLAASLGLLPRAEPIRPRDLVRELDLRSFDLAPRALPAELVEP